VRLWAAALAVVAFGAEARAQQPAPPTAMAAKAETSGAALKEGAPKAEPKADATELSRTVAALEERIRLLEARLASADSARATVPSAPTTDEVAELKKEVTVIQEETKKNSGFVNFFRDVEVSGIVDGYYSYNFNHPDGGINPGRAFDTRDNSFSLNLAKFTLEKKNDLSSPLGFKLDLGFGPSVDLVNYPDQFNGPAIRHVLQAYLSYVAPIGRGLTIDFGKFATPIGSEVIETKDNFNYTRSFLFTYGPYTHTGLRAKYAFNDKIAVTGFLLNGWDNFQDNNRGKTTGLSLAVTPTSRLSITQTYLTGPEQNDSSETWRHAADTVIAYVVNDKLTLLGNYNYSADELLDGTKVHWTGFAGSFRYAFNNRFAFSPRFEIFNDHGGYRTGVSQRLKELTLTQEIKLATNLLTRIEYRRDWSNENFFNKSFGRPVDSQHTLALGLSFFISSRGQ
jgi:hypothetical protein